MQNITHQVLSKTIHIFHIREKKKYTKKRNQMASRALEMVFGYVLEGTLAMQDMEIERRPYHKNCNCALHSSKGNSSSINVYACSHQRNIANFPKKQTKWSDFSLSMEASTSSSSSSKQYLPSSQNSLLC